jgi:hypothetical protein
MHQQLQHPRQGQQHQQRQWLEVRLQEGQAAAATWMVEQLGLQVVGAKGVSCLPSYAPWGVVHDQRCQASLSMRGAQQRCCFGGAWCVRGSGQQAVELARRCNAWHPRRPMAVRVQHGGWLVTSRRRDSTKQACPVYAAAGSM